MQLDVPLSLCQCRYIKKEKSKKEDKGGARHVLSKNEISSARKTRRRGERKANRAKRIKSASTDRRPVDLWPVLCPVCTRNTEDSLIIS